MRKYYIDNIRWITIVFVIIYHVVYMYNGVVTAGVIGPFHDNQWQDGLQYLMYPWFMVLLFIVSGMCSRYYLEKHSVREFMKNRTRKLLVPSTIGLFIFGWIQGYFNMEISAAFESMPDTMPGVVLYLIMVLSGTGVLWFAQMVWLFSVLLVWIRRWEKGLIYQLTENTSVLICICLVIPFYLSGLLLNTPIIAVYRFGIYGFSFFIGYFLFAHEEVTERLAKIAGITVPSALLLGVAYMITYFGENYAEVPVVNSVFAAVYGWIACLSILGGMKRWGDKRTALTDYMSKRSFGFYVFHYLPLSAAAYYLDRYTTCPAIICYIAIGIAAIAGSVILFEIISRIPILRWCVLGIK